MNAATVLIVEDDPAVRNVSKDVLQEDGFLVDCAENLAEGRERLARTRPDLLVLDINLPDGDGLEFCRQLSSSRAFRSLPILIITAKSATDDIVAGLEAGAEDYIVKPFNMREFMARVRAMVRRSRPALPQKKELLSGKLRLSLATHEAWCGKVPLSLTLREFDVLRVLMEHENEALGREEIIALAWGPSTILAVRVVDVHASHLRAKLGKEGRRIETVPQVGFRLAASKRL